MHKLFIDWFKMYRAEGNPIWRSLAYAALFAIDGIALYDIEADLNEVE